MDLPKTFKGKLAPRLRKIVIYRVLEQAEQEKRDIILPKDLLLSILDDDKTFGTHIIKAFNIDMQQFVIDIKKDNPIFQKPQANKEYHDSFFQLMKVAEKVMYEMQLMQMGTEHVILAFLRYSGKSKHILNYKEIFQKYGIEYEKFYEGVISISNHIENTEEEKEEPKQKIAPKKDAIKNTAKNNNQTSNDTKNTVFDQNLIKNLNKIVLEKNEKIVGRDSQILQCVRILCRKKKSNPIIIGEPGVGKSVLVEGIVQPIVNKTVPEKLAASTIYEISLGNIVAGTKYRGQFEEKMMNVIDFFSKNNNNSLEKIAFIDEIHHLIKAGSAEGAVDASFILKPKLADGTLRCIGTTTYEEYRKFILSDAALSRRFRPVFLQEPTIEQTIEIINKVKNEYEEYHGIKITKELVTKCVYLASTYVKDRFFPDKAFDILDESCAQAVLENSFENNEISLELKESIVEEVISNMTGIPLTTVSGSEKDKLSNLQLNIEKEVIGQKTAITSICNSIKRSRLGFKDKDKPMGCYLFVGRTGCGKTLLAKKISEYLFGPDKIIRLDMSEYMEKYSVSRIIGAPPGYVGYDSGGQLTEKIRQKPYSVLLFDEIEKAHPEVVNILLQILDEGRLTDSFGRVADFRNTIIIMTSNLAASKIDKANNTMGFNSESKEKTTKETEKFLKDQVEKYFPPEFVNRLDDVIVFTNFNDEDIKNIFEIELKKSLNRLLENGYLVEITDSAKDYIRSEGYSEKYGARPMSRAIGRLLEVPLANAYFSGLINGKETIVVDYRDGEATFSNKKGN